MCKFTLPKVLFLCCSLFGISIHLTAQQYSSSFPTRDSIVVKDLEPRFEKILKEVTCQLNLNEAEIRTDSTTIHYKIYEFPPGDHITYQHISLKTKAPELVYQFTADFFFTQEEFPAWVLPRLVIEYRQVFGYQFIAEVQLFSDEYWLLTINEALPSCGFRLETKLLTYNGETWTNIDVPKSVSFRFGIRQ